MSAVSSQGMHRASLSACRAYLEHFEGGSIGGRPANAQLLQRFDERGLSVFGGWPGEVLIRPDVQQLHSLPLLQRQQRCLVLLQALLAAVLMILVIFI